MEVEVFDRSKSGAMMTMQLLRVSCPKCRQPVEFVLSDEDRQYKADANYYKGQCEQLQNKVRRLNAVISTVFAQTDSLSKKVRAAASIQEA